MLSLEGLPTKAKEDRSPYEMKLCPTGHQHSISWFWGEFEEGQNHLRVSEFLISFEREFHITDPKYLSEFFPSIY